MQEKSFNLKESLRKIEDFLTLYLVEKSPFTLPDSIKEIIVKVAPYLVILGVVLGVPLVLAAFGLGFLVAPFTFLLGPAYAFNYSLNYVLSMVFFSGALIIEILAIPGLFKRQRKGWEYIFYASLINGVSGLLAGGLFSTVFSTLISWFLLFQVREYYK